MCVINQVIRLEATRFKEYSNKEIPSVFCFYRSNNERSNQIIEKLNKLCLKYPKVLCYKISFESYRKIIKISRSDSFNISVFQSGVKIHDIEDKDFNKLDRIFEKINEQCSNELLKNWKNIRYLQRTTYRYNLLPMKIKYQKLNKNTTKKDNKLKSNHEYKNLIFKKENSIQNPEFLNPQSFYKSENLKNIRLNLLGKTQNNILYTNLNQNLTETLYNQNYHPYQPSFTYLSNINYSSMNSLHNKYQLLPETYLNNNLIPPYSYDYFDARNQHFYHYPHFKNSEISSRISQSNNLPKIKHFSPILLKTNSFLNNSNFESKEYLNKNAFSQNETQYNYPEINRNLNLYNTDKEFDLNCYKLENNHRTDSQRKYSANESSTKFIKDTVNNSLNSSSIYKFANIKNENYMQEVQKELDITKIKTKKSPTEEIIISSNANESDEDSDIDILTV